MKSVASSAATGASKLGRLLDIEQITRPRLDGRMARGDGPEPYCTVCGGPAGIFFGHGPDWQHFRAPAGSGVDPADAEPCSDPADAEPCSDPAGVYATDHAPAIGWRYTTPTACTGSTCLD